MRGFLTYCFGAAAISMLCFGAINTVSAETYWNGTEECPVIGMYCNDIGQCTSPESCKWSTTVLSGNIYHICHCKP